MNNDQNNFNQNGEDKERIRFDECDFQNPYSQYYKNSSTDCGQDRGGYNPYSSHGTEEPDYRQSSEPRLLEMQTAKKTFSRIGFGYALFSVITFAVSTIISIVALYINEDAYSSTLFLNAVTPISLYVFALPVLLIVLSGVEARPPEKRRMSLKGWLGILIVAFGCMYIGSFVGNYVMAYLSELMHYDYSNALTSIIDNEKIWITAIFTVIVAPIGEEFVFRKLIIDRTQRYGAFVSIGLSALMFGLMHGNFYQFFYCFAIGLILGYIYYNTGKLWLAVAMHATVNFVGGVLTSFLQPAAEELETLDVLDTEALMGFVSEHAVALVFLAVLSIFAFVSMICAVILPIAYRRKIVLKRGDDEMSKARSLEAVVLNAGVIVMLAVYLIEFGINLLPV